MDNNREKAKPPQLFPAGLYAFFHFLLFWLGGAYWFVTKWYFGLVFLVLVWGLILSNVSDTILWVIGLLSGFHVFILVSSKNAEKAPEMEKFLKLPLSERELTAQEQQDMNDFLYLLQQRSWYHARFDEIYDVTGEKYILPFFNKYVDGDAPDSESKFDAMLILLKKKGFPMELEEFRKFISYSIYKDMKNGVLQGVGKRSSVNVEDIARGAIKQNITFDLPLDFNFNYSEERLYGVCDAIKELWLEGKIDRFVSVDEFKKIYSNIMDDKSSSELEDELNRVDEIPSWDTIAEMSGKDFEHFCEDMFKKLGYTVKRTRLTADQGADLIIAKDGTKSAVQLKRYAGSVGNKAVQEAVAARKHYSCDNSWVVTTGSFTKAAKQLASSNNVKLIDQSDLQKLVNKAF